MSIRNIRAASSSRNTVVKKGDSWSPASISNMLMWYDGKDKSTMTLSGANLSGLNDKSGNGLHLTTFSATKPTVDDNGIDLPNNVFMQLSGGTGATNAFHNLADSCTIFFAFKTRASHGAATGILWSTTQDGDTVAGSKLRYVYASSEAALQYVVNSNTTASISLTTPNGSSPLNTSQVVTLQKVPSAAGDTSSHDGFVYVNGLWKASQDVSVNLTNSFNVNNLAFNKNPNGGTTAFDSYIFQEFIVYKGNLTDAERRMVERYLAAKWNASYTERPTAVLGLVMGQSNAGGEGLISESTKYTNGQTLTGVKHYQPSAQDFVNFIVGTNNYTGNADSPTKLGINARFGEKLYTANGNNTVHILTYAVFGADLASFMTGGGNQANLQVYIRRCLGRLKEAGYGKVKIYSLWYQGESDANDATKSANYYSNFSAFQGQVQSYTQGQGVYKWLNCKIQRTAPWTYQDAVNVAQKQLGQEFIEATVSFRAGDLNHITADSAWTVGDLAGGKY